MNSGAAAWSRCPPSLTCDAGAEEVRTTELERTLRKLNGKLTSEERDSLDAMTRAIVNKLLHTPTVYLKDQAPPLGQQTAEEVFGVSPSSDED